MKKLKPELRFNSRQPSGNIYWILGELSRIMRKQSRIIAYNEIRDRVMDAQSYQEALQIIGEEVTLIDESKK